MSILDKKPEVKKGNFLRRIPGFRSNNPLFKTVAWVYYIFLIISIFAVWGEMDLLAMVLSAFAIPFIIAGIIDMIRYKEKNKGQYFLKKVVLPFVIMEVLVFTSISLPSSNVTDSVSEDKSQVSDAVNGDVESELNDELISSGLDLDSSSDTSQEVVDKEQEETVDVSHSVEVEEVAEAEIHFIDTGNSDAILIKQGDKAALIDGGDNDDEERVVSYLQSQGVTELEYVFATHPHADHIGGLDAVVDNIAIKNVYVSNGDMDTKTYADFMTSMVSKGLKPSVPFLNSEFKLGTSTFKVLSVANESDPNNNSLVLLYTNGEDKILLMGDAEAEIESQINPGDVDLLKVGHHGSHSSSTEAFIKKVSPEYAVILAGENNKYGHPHVETMTTLKAHNIKVHRTDECGTIVFKSTGKGLEVECKEGSYTPGTKSESTSSTSGNASTSSSGSSNVASSSTSSGSSNNSSSSSTSSGTSNSASSSSSSSSTSKPSSNSSSGRIVYANGGSSTSNKYHSSPTAHNMEGAIKMTESEAKSKGYVACKRCY